MTEPDRKRYADWPGGSQPFWPDEVVHHLLAVLGLLLVLAVVVFWLPGIFMSPEVPANPMETPEHIKPEWYFYFNFRLLKLTSLQLSVNLTMAVGAVVLFWPFLEEQLVKRFRMPDKVPVALGVLGFLGYLVLTVWEAFAA